MGSWKIMAIRSPRMSDISRSLSESRDCPAKSRRVAVRVADFGSSSMIASEVSDLPQPDSPTMASVRPSSTEKLMSRTGCSTPPASGMSTDRLSTARMLNSGSRGPSRRGCRRRAC